MSADRSVIRQPAGQRTLALRESYLVICDHDACEAQLLNALERWYAYKLAEREQSRGKNRAAQQHAIPADADESLWVRMSAEGWARDLLGIYNEKTIRTKLASLVARGFVETRRHPKWKWDKTPQWQFKRQAVQAAVDTWERSRGQPDLDPDVKIDDPLDAPVPSEDATSSTRTNVRMHADEGPGASEESSGSGRANVRSNNTGIKSQDFFTELPIQTSSATFPGDPRATDASDDDDQHAGGSDGRTDTVSPSSSAGRGEVLPCSGTSERAVGGTTLSPAAGIEQVPPAAGPAASAILALAAVPRPELEARPARDPEQMIQLRALLSASHKSRMPHLRAELELATPSGVPRRLLARLSDDEVAQATAAAQADATWVAGGFPKAGVHALHRLIGEPLTLDVLMGKTTRRMPVVADEASRRAAPEQDALPPVEEGSTWYGRQSGRPFTIAEVRDGMIAVEGIDTEYALARFHANFVPQPPETSA